VLPFVPNFRSRRRWSQPDLLVLAVVALITVPVLLSGHRISRLEGGAFVAAYLGYLVWLTLV
jgi:cation:H+ antiporter